MIRKLEDLRPFYLSIAKPAHEMTRAEASRNHEELMSKMPEMLTYFCEVLWAEGIDCSGKHEECLDLAGLWLVKRAKLVRKRGASLLNFSDDSTPVLSIPSMSACCYLGYLMGSFLLRDVPGAEWRLVTLDKRDMDYHSTVIMAASGRTQVEPTNIVMNYVYGCLDGSMKNRTLSDLYRIWKDALKG